MHAFTSPLSLDCTDQLLLPLALFLARFDLNRRFGGGSYLFANSLSGVNRPEHRCEHVEMDFMKLFGTVIAVLFHPGSTSKINGKNSERRSHTLSSASALETTRAYLFILLPSETYTEFFQSSVAQNKAVRLWQPKTLFNFVRTQPVMICVDVIQLKPQKKAI